MYKWPTDPVTSRWLEPQHQQHSLMKPSMLKMLNLESIENSGMTMMIPDSYFHHRVNKLGLKLQLTIQSEDSLTDTIQLIESHRGWSFQTILNYRFDNLDNQFQHHPDYLLDAQGLLGMELLDLNLIHMILINGDDELAEWILDFLADSSITTRNPRNPHLLVKFLSEPCRNGNTPLHLASFFGMADVVRKLLELGVNPNLRNQLQCKPVDCADSVETINLFQNLYENPLLEAMVLDQTMDLVLNQSTHHHHHHHNINNNNNNNNNTKKVVPMEYSNHHHHPSTSIIHSIGPPIGHPLKYVTVTSPLESMISDDTSSMESDHIKLPLKSCMKDPKYSRGGSSSSSTVDDRKVRFDTTSLLIHACQTGDLGLTQSLLAPYTSLPQSLHSLLTYRTPRHHSTLLHLTCQHRHPNLTQLLLNLNCDINALDWKNQTPLHLACRKNDLTTVQILLEIKELEWGRLDDNNRRPEELTTSSLIRNLMRRTYLRRNHSSHSPFSSPSHSPSSGSTTSSSSSTNSSPSPRWSTPPLLPSHSPTSPPRYCTKTLPRRPPPPNSSSPTTSPYHYQTPSYSSATIRYRHHYQTSYT